MATKKTARKPEFPRAAKDGDALEGEALVNERPGGPGVLCAAVSNLDPLGVRCSRRPHKTGDHVASDGRRILARWAGRIVRREPMKPGAPYKTAPAPS